MMSTRRTEVHVAWRRFKRWLYRGNRPHALARALNRGWAIVHALGIAPNYLVTLEVPGRRSGRAISFPLVMAVVDGERYLVPSPVFAHTTSEMSAYSLHPMDLLRANGCAICHSSVSEIESM